MSPPSVFHDATVMKLADLNLLRPGRPMDPRQPPLLGQAFSLQERNWPLMREAEQRPAHSERLVSRWLWALVLELW